MLNLLCCLCAVTLISFLIALIPFRLYSSIRKEISVTAQRQQSKLSIRQTKNYYTLRFFSLDIPLYFKIKKGDFEKTSDKYLKIKGKALQIGYTITSEQAISAVKYDLTNDEMVNLARKKLSIEAERELDGYEIVNAFMHSRQVIKTIGNHKFCI